ncbi:MAG: hypothetical protein IJ856_07670, partial [Candidatus Methanomethylophilaceae archaeon]|nr:hypothetical protein [Candidatus Methanomethylophilaceae archaeon]
RLCQVFMWAFVFIGVMAVKYIDHGPMPFKWVIVATVLLSSVMWVVLSWGDNYYMVSQLIDPNNSLSETLSDFSHSILLTVVDYLTTIVVFTLSSVGILSVICAYLKKYIVVTLVSLQKHSLNGTRGKSEKFFMVPDVLDVRDVKVEPERSGFKVDISVYIRFTLYMIAFGMVLCSYLFVNPYFLEQISWSTMLSIMLMLSIFMPSLLIPWILLRQLGARVVTDAPRDYFLWVGAKDKLFKTFMILGAIMMLLFLSLYYGNDPFHIFTEYLTYIVPLSTLAVIFALLYTNNFSVPLVSAIKEEFEAERSELMAGGDVDL